MPTSKAIGRPAIDYSFLHNSTVIVTGGASGLGAACVETFASHGAYVTIADLDEANGTRLATDLTAKGGHVAFAKCDTTDWASSVAAFKQAVNFGPSKTLDIAALFAGISGSNANIVDLVGRREEPTLDGDPGEMPSHKVIDINLNGVFLSTWLALYYFRLPRKTGSMQNGAERKESLVLIGSAAGYAGHPYNTVYGAAKFGVRGIFHSIRGSVDQLDVRVNQITPGWVFTSMAKQVHGIESANQPSKVTGTVLPWAALEDVVEATVRCAVDDKVDGRTFLVSRSGPVDLEEDAETGWGGPKFEQLRQDEGYADLEDLLARRKKSA